MPSLSPRTLRISAALSYLTLLAMIGLIGAFALFVVQPDLAKSVLANASSGQTQANDLTTGTTYALLLAGSVTLAVQLVLLWNMYGLFRLYSGGEALSRACGDHVRRIGLALLALPLATTAYGMASSVLISWHNPPGERELTIAISLHSIGFLVGGALLLIVGLTIRQAADVAEENRGFV